LSCDLPVYVEESTDKCKLHRVWIGRLQYRDSILHAKMKYVYKYVEIKISK